MPHTCHVVPSQRQNQLQFYFMLRLSANSRMRLLVAVTKKSVCSASTRRSLSEHSYASTCDLSSRFEPRISSHVLNCAFTRLICDMFPIVLSTLLATARRGDSYQITGGITNNALIICEREIESHTQRRIASTSRETQDFEICKSVMSHPPLFILLRTRLTP